MRNDASSKNAPPAVIASISEKAEDSCSKKLLSVSVPTMPQKNAAAR